MHTRGARGGLRFFRTRRLRWRAPQPRSRTRAGKPKNFLPFLCTAPPPTPPPKGEKRKGSFWFASPLIYLFNTSANCITIIFGKVSMISEFKNYIFAAINVDVEGIF